jgi:hypothetical protein
MQVENGLRKQLFQRDARAQAVAAKAWGLWEFYKSEIVFALASAPWDAAFALARAWNERLTKEPPTSSFLLHPAIAAACGCTHFLSFQPESRALAQRPGSRSCPGSFERQNKTGPPSLKLPHCGGPSAQAAVPARDKGPGSSRSVRGTPG